MPRWAGWTWVEIPAKKWISKSSCPVSEKIRGVLNNIPDILVKVQGSGVKFRSWTPFDPTFGRETCQIYEIMTQSKSSQTNFCRVSAHYSPPPASQTIKLGETPLGIILNNSCYSDGVQTPCFHAFQKMHIFANKPTH